MPPTTTLQWPVVALLSVVALVFCVSTAEAGDDLYEYVLEDATGLINETADVVITLNSADGESISGYSLAVCHDELVTLGEDGVVNGSTVADNLYLFHQPTVLEDGFTLGAALNIGTVLSPADDQELYIVTYDIGDETGTSEVLWCETGEPLNEPTVVLEDLTEVKVGEGLAVVDGEIEIIETPPIFTELAAGEAELTIASNGTTVENAEVLVSLSNDDPSLQVEAISFGISHDADELDLVDINMDGTILEDLNGGDGPELFITSLSSDGGTVAIVVSLEETPFDTIDAGTDQPICNFIYAGGDDAAGDDEYTVSFSESLGDPPVKSVVTVAGDTWIPFTVSGSVSVTELKVILNSFLRGDVNSSGGVELADGIRLLNFLFNETPVSCEATADINDDGNLQLNDATILLNFLFNEGNPPAGGGLCESIEEEECLESTPSCD